MNEQMGNIPAHIFDWLERYSFDQLSTQQQQEVAQYMSREEYAYMHVASHNIKPAAKGAVPGREDIKRGLLQHMDELHGEPKQKIIALQRANTIWKAAAVMLLMVCGGLGYYITANNDAAMATVLRVTDTVYAAAQASPISVVQHDTIYITRVGTEQKRRSGKVNTQISTTAVVNTAQVVPEFESLVMTPEKYEQRVNTSKGLSIEDDTLMQKYAFITL